MIVPFFDWDWQYLITKGDIMQKEERLLKFDEVSKLVSFKRTKIYKMIGLDKFPKPVKIGASSRWRLSEIQKWIENQS